MTEADYLRRTRDGYDVTAATYAERFHHHLHDKPLDRALLAFQVGDQPRVLTEVFGERVSLTFYRRRPDVVAELMDEAG